MSLLQEIWATTGATLGIQGMVSEGYFKKSKGMFQEVAKGVLKRQGGFGNQLDILLVLYSERSISLIFSLPTMGSSSSGCQVAKYVLLGGSLAPRRPLPHQGGQDQWQGHPCPYQPYQSLSI